jgi:ribosomal peptide maturation radical SAM protein 1
MSNALQDSSLPISGRNGILGDHSGRVLLISMPFGPLFQPSIGLGLLKAALGVHNIPSKVLYFTLEFAELIGVPLYLRISEGQPATYDLVGEWIFSGALFNSDDHDVENYLNNVLRGQSVAHKREYRKSQSTSENFISDILNVRSKVEEFLNSCLDKVIRCQPEIIAFTSIFQQHVAALSLAKLIKTKLPKTCIIFGGANCEGAMGVEVVRQFLFVDAVISGEGDIVFPQLIKRHLMKKTFSDLQGVYTRDNIELLAANGHYPNAPSVNNMDTLPFPEYEDFFQQLEKSDLNCDNQYRIRLLFETSRGCWWGERNHCTFCGLNGATLNYRSKSADRALEELIHLNSEYPNCFISVVDNILDMKYFKDFLPKLAALDLDLELFYEVKANLRKEQVRLLRDAGITTIQPGIESLSSRVLEMMRKGVKSLQNIQLLKWCKELGVCPFWNILWGFPGEPPEEYRNMTDLIPLLSHLPPPISAASIRLDRFSPNFDKSQTLGFSDVQPYPSYGYVYSLDHESIANLAYYFTFKYTHYQDVTSYTQSVAEQIELWQNIYESSDLFLVDKGTHLLIWDLRPVASKNLLVFSGLQRIFYILCDQTQTINQLQRLALENFNEVVSEEQIEELLQPFLYHGLMIQDANFYLSLAIPLGNYSPNATVLKRFEDLINRIGKTSGDQLIVPVN